MTVSASGFDLTPLTDAEKQQRAAGLTAEERRILLNQGTEPPFCGGLLDNKESGTYACKLCHLPLFHADSKFESGTSAMCFPTGRRPPASASASTPRPWCSSHSPASTPLPVAPGRPRPTREQPTA